MAKLNLDETSPHVRQYLAGNETFRRLFIHWMDTNGWTHPAILRVCTAAMGGVRWLHSSQISDFRSGKSMNPGPRCFISISVLNKAIYTYKTTKMLITGTKNNNDYAQAYAITVDDAAPPPDWWMGVFAGCIEPTGVPIDRVFHDQAQAEEFTHIVARAIRKLIAAKDFDIISDLNTVIHRFYPAGDYDRVEKLKEVLLNKAFWNTEEAELELTALSIMARELGDSEAVDRVLSQVIQR